MLYLRDNSDPATRSEIDNDSGMDYHRYPSLNWDDASWHERDEYTVIEVPLANQYNIMATWRLETEEGMVIETVHTYMMMVIRYGNQSRAHAFITTLIPVKEYIEKSETKLWHHRHDVRVTDYTGYVIYSQINGTMTDGIYFVDGEEKGRIISPLYKEYLIAHYGLDNSCDHYECTEQCCEHSKLNLPLTRSESDDEAEINLDENLIGTLSLAFIDTQWALPSYMSSSEWGGPGDIDGGQIDDIGIIRTTPPPVFYDQCVVCGRFGCYGGCMRPGGGGSGNGNNSGGIGSGNGNTPGGNGTGNGTGNGSGSNDNRTKEEKLVAQCDNLLRGNLTMVQRAVLNTLLTSLANNTLGFKLLSALLESGRIINLIFDPSMDTEGGFDRDHLTISLKDPDLLTL